MSDESEAWTGSAYDVKLSGGGWGKYIFIGFLILFIELPLISLGFGFGNIGLGVFGLLMLIATIYLPWRGKFFKRKAAVNYVLTNKRAMVIMGTGEGQQVLQQCDLNGATCLVQNYNVKSVAQTARQGGTSQAIQTEVGDVVFLKGGTKALTFSNVPDPNNVKATADQLIHSAQFSMPAP